MNKRAILFLGAIGILVASCLFFRLAWITRFPNHRIGPVSKDKIKSGMKESDFEDLLGVPSGVYTNMTPPDGFRFDPGWKPWVGDSYLIIVYFNSEGEISGLKAGPNPWYDEPKTSFVSRLRYLLGLR
jgi:hypothetical protein